MVYKQVVLVRNDLKLPKGKLAAQAAHACVDAILLSLKRDSDVVKMWRNEGMKKIVLKVENEKDLIMYFQKAKDNGLITSLITDAGRTVVEPGTKTCIAIGPNKEEDIDILTKDLKMI